MRMHMYVCDCMRVDCNFIRVDAHRFGLLSARVEHVSALYYMYFNVSQFATSFAVIPGQTGEYRLPNSSAVFNGGRSLKGRAHAK